MTHVLGIHGGTIYQIFQLPLQVLDLQIFSRISVIHPIKILILPVIVIPDMELTILVISSSSQQILYTPLISVNINLGKLGVSGLSLMPTSRQSLLLLFPIFWPLGWFQKEAWLWDPYPETWVSFLAQEWLESTTILNISTRLCRFNINLLLTLSMLGLFVPIAPLIRKFQLMKD